MTSILITTVEKKRLEFKAKQGWRAFFVMRDDYVDANDAYRGIMNRNRELVKQLKDGTECDLTYLKAQFIEMYDAVKKNSECPVCFEVMTKENMDVPMCGHLICKGCKTEIMGRDSKCPCCRKVFKV
jgi:hypothetical protein